VRTRAYWLFALVAVIFIGGVVLYLGGVPPEGPPPASSPVPHLQRTVSSLTPQTLPARADRETKGTSQARAQASFPNATGLLPPQNTKVKEVIAQLREDADRGVPQAACRLGEELMRCWRVKQQSAIRDQILSRVTSADTASANATTNQAADIASSIQKDKDLCEGVSTAEADDAWRYLLRAALGGSAAAQAQFAINPPLSAEDPVGSLDGWGAYRQYSPQFLRSSIQAGNVRAMYLAYFSAATGIGPGGQAVGGQDPYQALVYAQALLPLVDSQTAQQIQRQLPALQAAVPTQATQTAQEAQDLRTKYFGGKEPTDVSSQVGAINPTACTQ
jgi:hypothetical protein